MNKIYQSSATTSLNSTWSARRSPVFSQHGCVSSSQPLATSAGIEILRRGGNAADAAIAVASTLAVTEPCSTGLGGDFFMLYFEKATGKVTAINASGRSPSNLTYERAVAEASGGDDNKMNSSSAHCVTVPGAVRGWDDTVKRYGKFSLAENLSIAADIAERGFPVAPVTANLWAKLTNQITRWKQGGGKKTIAPEELLVQCDTTGELRAPKAGEIFKRPQVANVLRAISTEGADIFYNGWISEALVEAVNQCGGALSQDDMNRHVSSTFPDPIAVNYRGVDVYEHPPNGQGLCALIALNILNHLPKELLGPNADPAQRTHIMIECLRLAFADARQFIADPLYKKDNKEDNKEDKKEDKKDDEETKKNEDGSTTCPPELVQALLSPDYGKERAKMVDVTPFGSANSNIKHGTPLASCDTVSFQVIDAEGNAASVVNSNYEGFGSGIVPLGLGFSLQNRGANFSLEKGHANQFSPKKRPYHTIIPGMALKNGDLWCTFTNMGGFMQPQGHVQLLSNMLDLGMDPQAAIDCPRWCISQQGAGKIYFEEGTPDVVLVDLQKRGHEMNCKKEKENGVLVPDVLCGDKRAMFGRAQIILYNAIDGVCCAGSDGRGDGCAAPLLHPPMEIVHTSTGMHSDKNASENEIQSLTGEVFVYYKNQVAILKHPINPNTRCYGIVIFIPGLTDGLLGCKYVASLANMCSKENYIFVQPTLSSSWNGYGTSTLTQDVFEIDQLLSCPKLLNYTSKNNLNVILIGHSTGCQDAVHYVKHGTFKHKILDIILQAPVSDREGMVLEQLGEGGEGGEARLQEAIAIAVKSVSEGNGDVLMKRDTPGIFGVPMTAERYMSLSGKMTEEDLFSSDLTDNELNTQLGHVKNNEIEDKEMNTKRKTTKSCCVLSGSDQYVSSSLLEKYDDFGKRMALHLGGDYHIVKGGTHGLPKSIHYKEFIQVVQDRLKNIKQIMNS